MYYTTVPFDLSWKKPQSFWFNLVFLRYLLLTLLLVLYTCTSIIFYQGFFLAWIRDRLTGLFDIFYCVVCNFVAFDVKNFNCIFCLKRHLPILSVVCILVRSIYVFNLQKLYYRSDLNQKPNKSFILPRFLFKR